MLSLQIKKNKGLDYKIQNPYSIRFSVFLPGGWTNWSEPGTGEFLGFDVIQKQVQIIRKAFPGKIAKVEIKIAGKLYNPYGQVLSEPFITPKDIQKPVPKLVNTPYTEKPIFENETNKKISSTTPKRKR